MCVRVGGGGGGVLGNSTQTATYFHIISSSGHISACPSWAGRFHSPPWSSSSTFFTFFSSHYFSISSFFFNFFFGVSFFNDVVSSQGGDAEGFIPAWKAQVGGVHRDWGTVAWETFSLCLRYEFDLFLILKS